MNKKDIDYTCYLVTDHKDKTNEEILNIIEEALKGGTYELALKVKEITRKYDVPLLINDRLDIAIAIDADGVHIGQDDMPAQRAREIMGEEKIIGVSAATIEEARKAEADGADYIGTGAVFPTATKDDAPSITKDELSEITSSISIPTVAIGGITLENAHELKDTGIAGFSVVSAIMRAENPKEASEKLREIFNS